MLILGIDPGMSGAAVLIEDMRIVDVRRDFKSVAGIGQGVYDLALRADKAVIELVGAMPGQGVCSMFSFGEAYGAAQGALALAAYGEFKSVTVVHPIKWQNAIRAKWWHPRPAEFDSVAIATQLLSEVQVRQYLGRKKDHNTADAYLMAVYVTL